jgi:hypothetical protein
MNRKVFRGLLWAHPIEGTEEAKKTAATAHRNVPVKEIIYPLFGTLFRRTYAIHVGDDNAKAAPSIPSPARGGGLGWGLTGLAAIAKLRSFCAADGDSG